MGFEPTHFLLTKEGPYHLVTTAFEMERLVGLEPTSPWMATTNSPI